MFGWVRAVLVGALLLGATAAAPQQRASGAASQLIEMSGGLYRDPALVGYVRAVGMRLVASAEGGGRGWSFAVLDTPEVNAFSIPRRRIFVTRGLLALVSDEAELAAVLGHEIGHSLAGDGRLRTSAGTRREAEVAADRTGLALLTRAGYDPGAQADFLATLLASRALDMRLRGRDPARAAARAADHPALPDRLAAARREARTREGPGARNRGAYLAAIDGLTWGDGPAQGFMRGQSFVHPDLGFAFDAPPGYAVANLADAVVATGPAGAVLLMDSVSSRGGSPEDYLARGWVPEIARDIRSGPLEALRRGKLNGLTMAQGQLAMTSGSSARIAELTVVRFRDRFYRLTGLHTPGDARGQAALAAAAQSFRPLSRAEAERIHPLRVRVQRVGRGESVSRLAATMPIGPEALARFELMNGLAAGKRLRAGDLVKVVAE